MNDLKIPDIKENQWVIQVCELNTGFVINLEFKPLLDDSNSFRYFDSFEEAEQFALKTIESYPEFEVHIFGHKDSDIHYYKHEIPERIPKVPKQVKRLTLMDKVKAIARNLLLR